MNTCAGINGFGRFGLHLLKYWLDRNREASFKIDFINDDTITLEQAIQILKEDPYVVFNKYKVQALGDLLILLEPDGREHKIQYTHAKQDSIPWVGRPELFLECSGKNTVASQCRGFTTGKTRLVLISATSWDAQKALIYGFNHKTYAPESDHIVSYGSCTVNAFVPFAAHMDNTFGVLDSDVNVVHNIQHYKLKDQTTLIRKFCTLEKMGPALLPGFLNGKFKVNYTVVPYSGVSLIDFRFRVKKTVTRGSIIEELESAMAEGGNLKGLYQFDAVDIGPEPYVCTTYSTVFIREAVDVVGDNVYLQGYFDTENSVNRYYDLTDYAAQRLRETT